jgi:hypothetical protein
MFFTSPRSSRLLRVRIHRSAILLFRSMSRESTFDQSFSCSGCNNALLYLRDNRPSDCSLGRW